MLRRPLSPLLVALLAGLAVAMVAALPAPAMAQDDPAPADTDDGADADADADDDEPADRLDETVDALHVRDLGLHQLLMQLAQRYEFNLVLSRDVADSPVTLALNQVPVRLVLQVAAMSQGCQVVDFHGIAFVLPDRGEEEDVGIRMWKVSESAGSLDEVMQQLQQLAPGRTVLAHTESRVVLVQATVEELAAVERWLGAIDATE